MASRPHNPVKQISLGTRESFWSLSLHSYFLISITFASFQVCLNYFYIFLVYMQLQALRLVSHFYKASIKSSVR